MPNILDKNKQVAIIGGLAEGSSIRSLERHDGRSPRHNHAAWAFASERAAQSLLDAKMRDLTCERLQFDELWGFIGKKEKPCAPR